MSVAGVESVGCFGSTSRLRWPGQLCQQGILPMCVPSTIEVLQVAAMRGIVKCHCEILLDFGDNFEVVRYLKSLHVCRYIRAITPLRYQALTLNNPGQLVVLVEVQQLLA